MTTKIVNQIKKLPDAPGIYLFKKNRQILYIGKATSLRSRVRSYFSNDLIEKRSPWIAQMIALANKIDYRQTDSVLEALILESAEIKKHQPPYNTREKDDKSYLYVTITDEDFPRILTERGRGTYGPFPYGSELREALKIIRKIFPYRDKCAIPKAGQTGKLCFNAQIGLCPGVCGGEITKSEYRKTIRHLHLFFQGKKVALIKQLTREMGDYAKKQEFEKAEKVKRQIFSLQHIQDVAMIKRGSRRSDLKGSQGLTSVIFRIEAYDIAHLSGKNTVGAMVAMENQELDKSSYRKFRLRGLSAEKSDDTGNLEEILERRLKHSEWRWPDLIVVDGGQAQINIARHILANHHLTIPVVGVVKDEQHKAREVLGSPELIKRHRDQIIQLNQEAHRFAITYHRLLRRRRFVS